MIQRIMKHKNYVLFVDYVTGSLQMNHHILKLSVFLPNTKYIYMVVKNAELNPECLPRKENVRIHD